MINSVWLLIPLCHLTLFSQATEACNLLGGREGFWRNFGQTYEDDEDCGPEISSFICLAFKSLKSDFRKRLPLSLGSPTLHLNNEVIEGQLTLKELKLQDFSKAKLIKFNIDNDNSPTLGVETGLDIYQLDFQVQDCSGDLKLFNNAIKVECLGQFNTTLHNFNLNDFNYDMLLLSVPEECLTISNTYVHATMPKVKVSMGNLHELSCINEIVNYEISESLTAFLEDYGDYMNGKLNDLVEYAANELLAPFFPKCDETSKAFEFNVSGQEP